MTYDLPYDDPRPSTQPIGTTELAVVKDNLITLDAMVNAESGADITNRKGEKVTPIVDVIDGAESIVNEAIAEAIQAAGYQIVGDFSDTIKVEITSPNQIYTSKSLSGYEDYLWRTNQEVPYTPTGDDPTSSPELGKWVLVGESELRSIARSLNVVDEEVSYLNLIPVDGVHYLYEESSQVIYYSPVSLTGSISDIGTDVDGYRTIVVDSVSYEIVNINKTMVRVASDVEDMKKISSLKPGDIVKTSGYYASGDGGCATYLIAGSQTVDGYGDHLLDNGNVALIQCTDTINVKTFGALGDNSTDNADQFNAVFDYADSKGAGVYGGLSVYIPSGRYKTSPIQNDATSLRIFGDTQFSTRITAYTAAQSHIFQFTNASSNIDISNLEITGWTTTTELSNYPTYGLIFEDGTNSAHEMRVNRCRNPVWVRRGNYNRLWKMNIGFFDGVGVKLGGIDNGGNGAIISESRLEELSIYSSASNISGGASENLGRQIQCATDCGATIITNCEGGSTTIGIEIVDDLGLGVERGAGFVSIRKYNSGKNSEAGLWIKDNGSSVRVEESRFSAEDASTADGVRISSSIAAPVFYNCDWHYVKRAGIRITDGYAVVVQGGTFREIGDTDTQSGGIGISCADGGAKVTVQGALFESDMLVDTNRQMDYAIDIASGYSGNVNVLNSKAVDMLNSEWRNISDFGATLSVEKALTSGTLSLSDNSATTISLSNASGSMIMFSCEGNPATATTPSFIVQARSNVATAPVIIGSTNATNIATTTGALTGTTGADGYITLSSDGTDFYIENRLGAVRSISYSIVG